MTRCKQLAIQSHSHEALISITHDVQRALEELGIENGIVHVFVMHTTCGLTINENADPDVVNDLLHRLNELAPWNHPADKHMEGNSAAHLKSTILGSSVTIPVKNGRMILGTWQGIFFGEFDGPRRRTIHLTTIES